jgi:hypothetical protein
MRKAPLARDPFDLLDERRSDPLPARIRRDVTGSQFKDSRPYANDPSSNLCNQTNLFVAVYPHQPYCIFGHRHWRPGLYDRKAIILCSGAPYRCVVHFEISVRIFGTHLTNDDSQVLEL